VSRQKEALAQSSAAQFLHSNSMPLCSSNQVLDGGYELEVGFLGFGRHAILNVLARLRAPLELGNLMLPLLVDLRALLGQTTGCCSTSRSVISSACLWAYPKVS